MKPFVRAIILVLLMSGFFFSSLLLPAASQTNPAPPSGRLYNQASEETVTGKVTAIEQTVSKHRFGYGVHLQLQCGNEDISVHLGPAWYLERNGLALAVGDTLQIVGSRITLQDGPALIAAEVKKGEKTLRLRNSQGIPLWSGGPR